MPSIQDLRRRLRAVKSTQQITKAMKMVAAARLRRAQERVQAARPYTRKMTQILGDLARRASDFKHPLLANPDAETPASERIILALVTADKGLCGGFNTNLIKAASEFLRQHTHDQVELVLIGRKGNDFFHRRNVTIRRSHIGITGSGKVTATDAINIGQQLIADFTNEAQPVDKIYLLFGEFKSALVQKPSLVQLLPIGQLPENEPTEAGGDYLYEQKPAEIFEVLLPKLIENRIYQALLESVASEMGSRMTAMDSASKNASEVIDRLTLNMNRVRQAAITREIIEVVSGAEAL
ncbi:MAG: ATP synthase F1 subunit gamma [Acidobacteria bacterium]|nr:ATP synthase F1 subunit gamma [Acidobacteriota bacterium]MBI3426695.1 ATP synthase F1 subunit gamma [Acidobacteriota bacterium]